MNLAETGQRSYKQDHQLFLVSAAYDNIISRMMQNAEYEEFIAGKV